MATVAYTSTQQSMGDGSILLYTWVLTTANADGAPISAPEWADRTWQAAGTFGGATTSLQGSNDLSNWFNMSNAAGGAVVAITAAAGAATIELPLWVRPNLTAVGVGATITVTLLARRATPLRA